jgi:CO/xanthine dehydrogenase Mo-binding subunit
MSGYYTQAIAEELNMRPEAVSLLMGDTDRTPDGGYSAGFVYGMNNVRKVAAYAYQGLLDLASTRLGVPKPQLLVVDGIVHGGGRSVTYGQLVQGQQLDLRIPVTGRLAQPDPEGWLGTTSLDGFNVGGDPPLKPMSQFKVIGTSFPVPGIPDKVTGKTLWSCDVRLPGMLHARMVRPATLGATLICAGKVDHTALPTAKVVRKGNLLAVVAEDEWEAISAARSVAADTRWTDWSGLPGSENLTQALRQYDWGPPSETRGNPAVVTELANASRKIVGSYEQPYVRHAPIGPYLAVADVRSDGSVTVYTHSAQSQGLRARLAHMLGTPAEKVVVRWLEHSGQYGRTTFGGDGAEADAVVLSQLTGRPVRVQWTLQEDLEWSTASPGWICATAAALDAQGNITALHNAFRSPHMTEVRALGALLAGIPCYTSKPGGFLAMEWPYDRISNRLEEAFGMPNLGAETASGGLRGHIMRTPGQRQQNFALESLLNEAAAATQTDPIEFRLRHTSERRLINVLNATAKAADWVTRPSPHRSARKSGATAVEGQGVCVIKRQNSYWAGIARIAVIPATGVIKVTHFTIGVDCGKVINPRQLDRCMKSGVVMGLSEALKEEVTFDSRKVTSTDWSRYQILTMEEMPEIKVVQLSRDDCGFGGGSEAANAVCPGAVAAALFDATGVAARRIPLTPGHVAALLKS